MKVEQGQFALVTGGGSGVGRALALALASRGVHVTVLDVNTDQGHETVRLVEEEHARNSYKPTSGPSATFIRCDVTKSDELAAAFSTHLNVFGRLHICINSAGVINRENPFHEHEEAWRKVIDVNLIAVINSTCKAIQAMKHGGVVLNISSAYGFVPNFFDPIYATSKAGVVMFTRSLAHLGMDIRVNALCPEYMDTPLLSTVPSTVVDYVRDEVGFVDPEKLISAAFSLLDDESKVGECLWVPANRPAEVWPDEETRSKDQIFQKDGSIFTGIFN